jgi:hypothetical protein
LAELIIAVAARQLQATFMVREVFRVHERQIEELTCQLFLLNNSPYVPSVSHRSNL